MARKRGLTRDELEHFANLSESEWEEFLEDNSEDDQNYELSSDASDCSSSENEYDKNEENAELSVDDMDVQQQCPAHTQHISWCETEQDPPQFNFRENSGLQFDSRNLTIETLVDLFFTQEFLDLLVAQTNLNANQEIGKEISVRLDHDYILNEDQIFVGYLPIEKLRRKLDIANKSLKENEKNKKQEISGEEFKQACDRFLPPQFSKAAQVLSNLKNRKAQGRRFTGEFKQHALGLYFASPKAYRIMVKKYHFPSVRSLKRMTENLQYSPGFNDFLFRSLQLRLKSKNDNAKLCIITMDEVSLKTHLFYDQKRDEIIGFHDIGKGKESKPAQNALVLMARGIEENWKQPLAFFFVNSTCNAQDLQSILHECITRMLNIGARKNHPLLLPHLLKCMRNLLLQNTVHFDGKEASWKFVEQLFNLEKNKDLRMAPKLSEAHIHPTNFQKMKVKYAAQVLSSTVSSGSYKTKKNIYTIVNIVALSTYMAMRTAEFIEKIDHLFDILNSSTQASKNLYRRPYKGTPQQDAFLHEMTQFFKKIRLFRHENSPASYCAFGKREEDVKGGCSHPQPMSISKKPLVFPLICFIPEGQAPERGNCCVRQSYQNNGKLTLLRPMTQKRLQDCYQCGRKLLTKASWKFNHGLRVEESGIRTRLGLESDQEFSRHNISLPESKNNYFSIYIYAEFNFIDNQISMAVK
ncbi:hypothetical protein TcasGA2_TC001660 [Tribolium castaneum]|uniref:Uncharacterized protein n=1 Tax=Tribolium castaneum TaxID=7070 RepID=D6X1L8_TRICA|nr:hypothetical protein TcasGA2_TC001660 [Tribolium castaneum]